MAFAKFSFVFVCALLVSQALPNPLSGDVQANDLAKQVKKLILDITGLLEKVINQLSNATSVLSKDGLEKLQKESVAVTLKVLGEFKKIIDKELDRIQPQLNADAKIVSKCLETNGQEIIQIIVDYYNTTSICFNPVLKPVLVSLEPLLADLKKVDTTVATFAPSLDKCDNDICVFGVIQQVIKQLNVLPDILKKDLPAIETTVKAFATEAVNCAKKEAVPWEKASYQIFNKVATCYRSK